MFKFVTILSLLTATNFQALAAEGDVLKCDGVLRPSPQLDFQMVDAQSDQSLRELLAYGSRRTGVINWARRNQVPRSQARILFRTLIENLTTESDTGSERLNRVADQVRTTATSLISSRSFSQDFIFGCVFVEHPVDECWTDRYDISNMNCRGLMAGEPQAMVGPLKPLTLMYRARVGLGVSGLVSLMVTK